MQQDVDDLEDKVRLHGHEHLCIEVGLEAVDHLVQQARYLPVEGGPTRLRNHRANEHAVRVLQESVAEGHWVAVRNVNTGVCEEHEFHLGDFDAPI